MQRSEIEIRKIQIITDEYIKFTRHANAMQINKSCLDSMVIPRWNERDGNRPVTPTKDGSYYFFLILLHAQREHK